MIPKHMTARRLVAAALGTAVLAAGVPAPGFAEQIDNPVRAARSDQGAAHQTPKPATAAARAALSPNAPGRETKGKPWSIEDALPRNSRAVPADASTGSSPGLGRVPLQTVSGSFGLETENKIKPTEFPDGRPVPGLAPSPHHPTQYLGLSLSVPSHDKSMTIPVPLVPSWMRAE